MGVLSGSNALYGIPYSYWDSVHIVLNASTSNDGEYGVSWTQTEIRKVVEDYESYEDIPDDNDLKSWASSLGVVKYEFDGKFDSKVKMLTLRETSDRSSAKNIYLQVYKDRLIGVCQFKTPQHGFDDPLVTTPLNLQRVL